MRLQRAGQDSEEHSLGCLQGVCTLNYYFYTENSKEQAMSIKERMGLEAVG